MKISVPILYYFSVSFKKNSEVLSWIECSFMIQPKVTEKRQNSKICCIKNQVNFSNITTFLIERTFVKKDLEYFYWVKATKSVVLKLFSESPILIQ